MTKNTKKIDKVIRNGKTAVVVSPGYGAGWYTWNDYNEELLFHPRLVAAILGESKEKPEKVAAELWPDAYDGGLKDARVVWVPEGTLFRIDEYDGSEKIVTFEDDCHFKA